MKINSAIHFFFQTVHIIGRVMQLNENEQYDPPEIRAVRIIGPIHIKGT